MLNETLSGNLFCAEKTIIEQNGVLTGNITCKSCVIGGIINGDIISTEQTEIRSTAVIQGTVRSPSINIHVGATVNGLIIMEPDGAVIDLLDFSHTNYGCAG